MICRRPKYYPHCGLYAYKPTQGGHFSPRVRNRLLRRGFRQRDVDWLERLYFYHPCVAAHCDALGYYRNHARCRLYHLSRSMHHDRKMPLICLVMRSGLFEVGLSDDRKKVVWFRSPFNTVR